MNEDLVPLYFDNPGVRHTALRYARARRGRFRHTWAWHRQPLYAVACDVFDRWIEKLARTQPESDRRLPLGWLDSMPETALDIDDSPVMTLHHASCWIAARVARRYRLTDPMVYHPSTINAIERHVSGTIEYQFAPACTHALVSPEEMRLVRVSEKQKEPMDTLSRAYFEARLSDYTLHLTRPTALDTTAGAR